jgi:hypothetical protein
VALDFFQEVQEVVQKLPKPPHTPPPNSSECGQPAFVHQMLGLASRHHSNLAFIRIYYDDDDGCLGVLPANPTNLIDGQHRYRHLRCLAIQ